MALSPSSSRSSSSGTVTGVTATDASIVVAGTATAPTIATGTLDVIAAQHPPVAAVALNAKKITGLANGSAATDALALGQVLAANVIPVANLVAGTAGQVLGGTGPSYALPPGFEFGYDQITAPVTVVSTTESAGTTIITCAAHVFDGGPVMAIFNAPYIAVGATANEGIVPCLFEGATQLGRFSSNANPVGTAGINDPAAVQFRFTPTAASHTYTVTAFGSVTTGAPSIGAGAGGTAAYMPCFIRFVKV